MKKSTNAMKTATINEQDHTVTIDGRVFKIGEEVTPKPTPEERLLQLLEGVVRKHDFDKFPNTASFWLKEGKVVAQEMKSGNFSVDSEKIWKVFEREYGLEYAEIKLLIANTVEKHFNCKGVTPKRLWLKLIQMVEKHFDMKK